MTTTSHLGLTLVEQSQSQKEVTINEALARIDAVLNTGAINITNTPAASPAAGDVYIVGTAPTGVWTGYANAMAYYDQVWRFIAPRNGMQLYVQSAAQLYLYNGSGWVVLGAGGSGTYSTLQTFSAGINVGNSAQTSPTTLDWYEEGTFTPVLYGASSAGTGTYSVQIGKYTRIGNRVDVHITLTWSAHTGTGEGRISGLPYTNPNNAMPLKVVNVSYAVSSGAILVPYIEGGVGYIRLSDTSVTTGTIGFPNLDTSASLYITGTYFL